MRMLKSYITWRAIDSHGRLIVNTFTGSRQLFNKFIREQQLNLISTHTQYQVKLRHNHKIHAKFTADLEALLNSNIELTTALHVLRHRYADAHTQTNISQLITALHHGKSLSAALACHPDLFDPSYLPLLKAAEATQQLPQLLTRIVELDTKAHLIKAKLQKALIYPACVLAFTAFISAGLLTFAIPQFEAIFISFNAQLPTFTQSVITLSKVLSDYKWGLLLLSCGIGFICYYGYKKMMRVRSLCQTLLSKLPWIGGLYCLKLVFNWCTVFAIGVKADLSLHDSLMLANNTLTHIHIRQRCDQVINRVANGQSLSVALASTELFDRSQLYIIQLGELSQNLAHNLEQLATEAAGHIEQRLDYLSKWLEPVIMLILAVVAGGLIISMYLPIFKMGALL